jgi:hypothetical protein
LRLDVFARSDFDLLLAGHDSAGLDRIGLAGRSGRGRKGAKGQNAKQRLERGHFGGEKVRILEAGGGLSETGPLQTVGKASCGALFIHEKGRSRYQGLRGGGTRRAEARDLCELDKHHHTLLRNPYHQGLHGRG